MITSIELQVISKLLTTEDTDEAEALLSFDPSYYSVFKPHIEFIFDHYEKYKEIPDVFTFQSEFPDVTLVSVNEPLEFLDDEMKRNKQHIILVETFNKLQDLGADDVSEAWQYIGNQYDRVQQLDATQPMNIVKDAKQRADQVIEFSRQARIPTGFAEIDKLMYGGLSTVEELVLIVARTNTGKAQPLYSKVLTPSGWEPMGNIEVGDTVIGENNDVGQVVEIFPQGVKDYYRITFDDNSVVECCDDHLWKVRDFRSNDTNKYMVVTTHDILTTLDKSKYVVDISDAIEFNIRSEYYNENSDGDSYILGTIIGDNVKKYDDVGYCNENIREVLPSDDYLLAPIHIRRALVEGIADSCCKKSSDGEAWGVTTYSRRFAKYLVELVRSLGGWVKLSEDDAGRDVICCITPFDPFECTDYHHLESDSNHNCKVIRSVEYAGKTECKCILLNNKSHTYITDGYTVTHNTWVTTKMMESAQKNGFPVLYYSPEMQASFLGTRFDTWRGNFQNSQILQGHYNEQYFEYLKLLSKEETAAYVLEDKDVSDGVVNVPVLKSLVKRLGIKLLVVDGLSYMEDTKRSDTDYVKYKNICTSLFKLSKQFGCAVVVSVQANRETKDIKDDKGDPFPNLYNIEGSDHPGRIATQAFSLRQIFDKHVLDIRLEKSRMANNQRPTLSYAWDVNVGTCRYLPGGEDDAVANAITPSTVITPPSMVTHIKAPSDIDLPDAGDIDLDDDDDIEF